MHEIRLIHAEDFHALIALYGYLNPEDPSLPDDQTIVTKWRQFLTDQKISCFVIEEGSLLIASCTLIIIPNMTRGARPYGLIENVVTHPDHRKQGLGTKILQHALAKAWQADCYKVMLMTGRKSEETLRFYEKAGFVQGIKTGFVAKPSNKL